ncbi:uncharacterized protein LOC109836363 [Asparagus officinalis]|uniref:uncharacterized protein LOC109836363 n=1 Tax=Asparagus officinalis TaxID=4686 RepID=UPI00098E143F|nr:uncharacterized protein LOC109836363 [Asparagus officinalis]
MWIQLPALKLNLWNEKGISKIASLIGRPIATDKLTANRQRLAYARVLIEVKLPSALPDQITVNGPNGKQYNQKIIYELKPRWCDHCKQVGHDIQNCRRKPVIQKWVPKLNTVAGLVLKENNPGSMRSQDNINMQRGIADISGPDTGGFVHVVHAKPRPNSRINPSLAAAPLAHIQKSNKVMNPLHVNPFSSLLNEVNDADPSTIDRGDIAL